MAANLLSKLCEQRIVLVRDRQNPRAIQDAGGPGGAQPSPKRNACTGGGGGKLRQEKKPLTLDKPFSAETRVSLTRMDEICNRCFIIRRGTCFIATPSGGVESESRGHDARRWCAESDRIPRKQSGGFLVVAEGYMKGGEGLRGLSHLCI